MNEIYKCLCENKYNESEFKTHIQICNAFKIKFKKFDTIVSLLIKSYSDTEEDLRFVKFLLKRFIKLINIKLNYNQVSNKPPKLKSVIRNINPIERDLSNEFIVLKSLSSLDCINSWFNKSNINQFKDESNSTTKEFYKTLDMMYKRQHNRPSDIQNLICIYENNLKSNNINIQNDPYNFLNNFLDLLHHENINIINENMNMYNNQDEMYNIQNSFISECFFNKIRKETKCNNSCPGTIDFSYEKIFIIEADKYKSSKPKVMLEKCLSDYIKNGQNIECNNCKTYSAKEYKTIYNPVKVLIIYFKRSFPIDVLFKKDLTIYPYICPETLEKINLFFYTLKACISYNNQNKYFTDIFINNKWYRFIDEDCKPLNDMNDVLVSEPIILIYELKNIKNNINNKNDSYNNMNLNNVNIFPVNKIINNNNAPPINNSYRYNNINYNNNNYNNNYNNTFNNNFNNSHNMSNSFNIIN